MLKTLALAGILLMPAGLAAAADAQAPAYTLVIEGHRFQPAELQVPANTRLRLVIENRDATPEEFESEELDREKIVPGKGTITVIVGPLKPGRYPFFGEFHEDTAQGALVAR